MRKICSGFFLLALLPTFYSCLTEQNVDLAKPPTFVRYISGGNIEVARALEKTPDRGYIILANRQSGEFFRIKLIKTDEFGNVEWTRLFPSLTDMPDATADVSMKGNGISLLPGGGYIIAGDVIQNNTTKLFILVTDGEGLTPRTATLSPPSATGDLSGLAVTTKTQQEGANFIVLGNISGSTGDNMILTEVNAPDLSILWDRSYGTGPSTLVNKIFIDENQKALWSGTVTNGATTDMRFIKTPQNSELADFDNPFGEPGYDERANDVCRFGTNYALVGSTNEKTTGTDRDIIFKRITGKGILLSSKTFPLLYSDSTDTHGEEEGNSIAYTKDTGFIILGTIVSATSPTGETIGRGEKDYYLIKVNGFGDVEWTRAFGSKREDGGVSVVQADDGGYVVLGTTQLANVATIALIKTNKDGNVE